MESIYKASPSLPCPTQGRFQSMPCSSTSSSGGILSFPTTSAFRAQSCVIQWVCWPSHSQQPRARYHTSHREYADEAGRTLAFKKLTVQKAALTQNHHWDISVTGKITDLQRSTENGISAPTEVGKNPEKHKAVQRMRWEDVAGAGSDTMIDHGSQLGHAHRSVELKINPYSSFSMHYLMFQPESHFPK